MIDRRSLFAATTAAGSFLAAVFGSRKAKASVHTTKNAVFPGDIEPRGSRGRYERLPSLDLESKWDFTAGMRTWGNKFVRKLNGRAEKILSENGFDPKEKLTAQETLKLVEKDHVLGSSGRVWISNQQVTWKILQDHFYENGDHGFSQNDDHFF